MTKAHTSRFLRAAAEFKAVEIDTDVEELVDNVCAGSTGCTCIEKSVFAIYVSQRTKAAHGVNGCLPALEHATAQSNSKAEWGMQPPMHSAASQLSTSLMQPVSAGMRKLAEVMAAECAGAIEYTTSKPRIRAEELDGAAAAISRSIST
jgi:hypothetical protein